MTNGNPYWYEFLKGHCRSDIMSCHDGVVALGFLGRRWCLRAAPAIRMLWYGPWRVLLSTSYYN